MTDSPNYLARLKRDLGLFVATPTGRWCGLFSLVVVINFIAQLVLKWELAPGEFAMLNACLGVVALMTAPLFALELAFVIYFRRPPVADPAPWSAALRQAHPIIVETAAVTWGGICLLLSLTLLPFLDLPRGSQEFFILLAVFALLAAAVNLAMCRAQDREPMWWRLLLVASVARLLLGAVLGWFMPWAEAGLLAIFLAALIPAATALKTRDPVIGRATLFKLTLHREFLLCFGATFSVVLGLLLFSQSDRIVAQPWFGTPLDNTFNFINWPRFDAYEISTLPARTWLIGTLPLLAIFFARRAALVRTTRASLRLFWVYLALLVIGAIFLSLFSTPLAWLFCGDAHRPVASLMSSFSFVMLALGLLQGLAVFALASRRYIECFVLGGGSVGYFLVLALFGRQPLLMMTYMIGGTLMALMAVLCVGVVRYARQNP